MCTIRGRGINNFCLPFRQAVLFQTDSMLNKITQEQKESHWVDGDWDHILANFEFPDISKKKFSFVSFAFVFYRESFV